MVAPGLGRARRRVPGRGRRGGGARRDRRPRRRHLPRSCLNLRGDHLPSIAQEANEAGPRNGVCGAGGGWIAWCPPGPASVLPPFHRPCRGGAYTDREERASDRLLGRPLGSTLPHVPERQDKGRDREMKDSGVTRWMGFLGIWPWWRFFVGFGAAGGRRAGENASGVTCALVQHPYGRIGAPSMSSGWPGPPTRLCDPAAVRAPSGGRPGSSGPTPLRRRHLSRRRHRGARDVPGDADSGRAQPPVRHREGLQLLQRQQRVGDRLRDVPGQPHDRLGHPAEPGRPPLPKTLGWYSLLVAVLAAAGPDRFLDFLFGFPIWLIATGFVHRHQGAPGHARTVVRRESAGGVRAAAPLVTT